MFPDCVNHYMHFSEKEAEEFLKKADKARTSYYNYYTEKIWGAAESYDLCINSSFYGIDKTVEFIEKFIEIAPKEWNYWVETSLSVPFDNIQKAFQHQKQF